MQKYTSPYYLKYWKLEKLGTVDRLHVSESDAWSASALW